MPGKPLPPALEASFNRALNAASKLVEALEDLDCAGGLKRLSPVHAGNLLPLLADLRSEAEAAVPVLEKVAARPAVRGLVRKQANRPPLPTAR